MNLGRRVWTSSRAAGLAMLFGLAACGADPGHPGPASAEAWRTFENADGSVTTIPSRPERILSTSVAITGTLLAIDAPVVTSASAADGQYFAQWAEVARERGVRHLWPAGNVDLEAAYAARPDLIVVASSGADSALPQLAEFRQIAPTILLDYGNQTWQSLATRLGEATGLEAQAAEKISGFDAHVAGARARIAVPEGQANIISYNGPGISNPIATPESAHGQLLGALGFDIEAPDPAWHRNNFGNRGDFVWAQYEYLTRLTASTTFLLRVDDDKAAAFLDDPVLVNLPSVRSRRVYGLGANSFRVDYYSGTEIVDDIVDKFAR